MALALWHGMKPWHIRTDYVKKCSDTTGCVAIEDNIVF